MSRLIMGVQPVREAVRVHGGAIERLLVDARGGPTLEPLARWAAERGVAVERVPAPDLDRRAAGGRHQGVMAFGPELRLRPLASVQVDATTCILALDGVMDPQNFGAAVRSAVALGATAIVWPEHASAPLTPSTFRASAGAIEHAVLVRVASLTDGLRRLAEQGTTTIALDAQADVELANVDLTGPVALVVGAEDKGVRRGVRKACAGLARLPMVGPIASLNASVAAAIALYEVARQRQGSGRDPA